MSEKGSVSFILLLYLSDTEIYYRHRDIERTIWLNVRGGGRFGRERLYCIRLPVGQRITDSRVPLYCHTDNKEDRATH